MHLFCRRERRIEKGMGMFEWNEVGLGHTGLVRKRANTTQDISHLFFLQFSITRILISSCHKAHTCMIELGSNAHIIDTRDLPRPLPIPCASTHILSPPRIIIIITTHPRPDPPSQCNQQFFLGPRSRDHFSMVGPQAFVGHPLARSGATASHTTCHHNDVTRGRAQRTLSTAVPTRI